MVTHHCHKLAENLYHQLREIRHHNSWFVLAEDIKEVMMGRILSKCSVKQNPRCVLSSSSLKCQYKQIRKISLIADRWNSVKPSLLCPTFERDTTSSTEHCSQCTLFCKMGAASVECQIEDRPLDACEELLHRFLAEG
ncbi:hypothetical protein J6590_093244, partial [Homalodisca vitripennis]